LTFGTDYLLIFPDNFVPNIKDVDVAKELLENKEKRRELSLLSIFDC
jgi:hypothetical protein